MISSVSRCQTQCNVNDKNNNDSSEDFTYKITSDTAHPLCDTNDNVCLDLQICHYSIYMIANIINLFMTYSENFYLKL